MYWHVTACLEQAIWLLSMYGFRMQNVLSSRETTRWYTACSAIIDGTYTIKTTSKSLEEKVELRRLCIAICSDFPFQTTTRPLQMTSQSRHNAHVHSYPRVSYDVHSPIDAFTHVHSYPRFIRPRRRCLHPCPFVSSFHTVYIRRGVDAFIHVHSYPRFIRCRLVEELMP